MPMLLMLSPAPVRELPGGELLLDARFVEGMKLHCQFWPGTVTCVLRRGAGAVPDGLRFTAARLGFRAVLLDPGAPLPDGLLESARLVYCAADDLRQLDLPQTMHGRVGRVVYSVEQSLGERLRVALVSPRPLRRRIGAAVWNLRHERHLRRSLAEAAGLHLNGPAAAAAYGRLNPAALAYLDNRIRQPQLARQADQAARVARLADGQPLRLVAPGPLDTASGAMDLIEAAFLLRARGVAFGLDILGTGPLEGRLRAAIAATGLGALVRLAGAALAEPALLARLRTEADLALIPRTLPEGPATAVEVMGCGVPILARATPGWRRLARASGGGWALGGGGSALAAAVARLDGRRAELIAASARARDFAAGTTFEKVFAARMAHLRTLAGLD